MSGQDVERDVALVREALEHGGAQFNVPQALAALDRLTARVREARTENARLREALERIAAYRVRPVDHPTLAYAEVVEIARATLADPYLPIGHPTC